MVSRYSGTLCALAAAAAMLAHAASQRWQVQYFYDKSKSVFAIADMQFPSAERGIVVGEIEEKKQRRPVAVVTSDGGAHWQTVELKDHPVSLYFRSENLGWMVTTGGLWRTKEAGKSWQRVGNLGGGFFRVYFSDDQNGFAAGVKKKVMETHDGGAHWSKVDAAAEPPGDARYSAYNWIAFATAKIGLISGFNRPPRPWERGDFPDWMTPEDATIRRETPHLSYLLVTQDGGKTWKSTSGSVLGQVSRIRFASGAASYGLVEYSNSFRYPAEVYRIDWKTSKMAPIYRNEKFDVSDVWVTPDSTVYLGGVEVTGKVRDIVPAKVKVLRSSDPDFKQWEEIPVDYRAVGNRVLFAGSDDTHLWMAVDNGMILKLAQ